jgi:hypothetical protein
MENVLLIVVIALFMALIIGVIRRIQAIVVKNRPTNTRRQNPWPRSPRFGTKKYYLSRIGRGLLWVVKVPFRVLWGIVRIPFRFICWSWHNRPGRAYRALHKPVYTEAQMKKAIADTAFVVYAAGVEGWELLPPAVMGHNRIVMQQGPHMVYLKDGEWKNFKARRVGFERNAPAVGNNGIPKATNNALHWANTAEGKDAIRKAVFKYRNDLVPQITDDDEAAKAMWNLIRARMYDGQETPFESMDEFKGNQGQALERIHKILKNDVLTRKQQKPLL